MRADTLLSTVQSIQRIYFPTPTAGVKLMATHDGHDVHVSAQPAVHTPIDSDASSIQATQCLCRTQQCSGERRRSARRWASLATLAASMRRAARFSSRRTGTR